MIIKKKNLDLYDLYIKYLLIFFPLFLIIGPATVNFFTLSVCIYTIVNYQNFIKLFKLKDKIYLLILLSIIFVYPYNSINFENSLIKFFGYIKFPLLFFGLTIYLKKNSKNSLIFRKYWIVLLLIISFDVLKEYSTGTNFFGSRASYTGRIASFTNDELIIGYIFLVVYLFCIPVLKEILNKKYIFFLLFFLISVSFVIGERSNFIKFLIFSILNLVIFFPLSNNNIKNLLILLIMILSLFYIFSKTPQYDKLISNINIFKNFTVKIYENPHFAHYITAIQISKKYPFFGIGLNNFYFESSKEIYSNKKFRFNKQRSSTHPHNTHFEILVDLGLIGYVFFLILFILIIKEFFIKNYGKYKIYSTNHFFLFLFFIIPILPTGSFFGTVSGTVFWLNLAFLMNFIKNEK